MTAAQRNKLDAARWRKLIATMDASATKTDTIQLEDGRELIVSKPDYRPDGIATISFYPPQTLAERLLAGNPRNMWP